MQCRLEGTIILSDQIVLVTCLLFNFHRFLLLCWRLVCSEGSLYTQTSNMLDLGKCFRDSGMYLPSI